MLVIDIFMSYYLSFSVLDSNVSTDTVMTASQTAVNKWRFLKYFQYRHDGFYCFGFYHGFWFVSWLYKSDYIYFYFHIVLFIFLGGSLWLIRLDSESIY